MQNHLKAILLISITFILGITCSDNQKDCAAKTALKPSTINPNGDSELALLMRDMYDDLERVKSQIAEGKAIESLPEHQRILTAHATEPEKAASPEYKAFATIYLQYVEALQKAEPKDVEKAYGNLINGCMSCHQALCPGPIVKIKKLL